MESSVSDLAAGKFAAARYFAQKFFAHFARLWEMQTPQSPALFGVGRMKFDRHIHAPLEGAVDAPDPRIRGDEENSFVTLESLEKKVCLEIRVTVVRVLHIGALAEQGVAFIEEQDHIEFLRCFKDAIQIFLRLADVFVHHGREIEPVKILLQPRSEQARSERFASAARSGEKRAHADRRDGVEHRGQMLAMAATTFEMLQFAKSLRTRREAAPIAFCGQPSRERVKRFSVQSAEGIEDMSADWLRNLRQALRASRASRAAR